MSKIQQYRNASYHIYKLKQKKCVLFATDLFSPYLHKVKLFSTPPPLPDTPTSSHQRLLFLTRLLMMNLMISGSLSLCLRECRRVCVCVCLVHGVWAISLHHMVTTPHALPPITTHLFPSFERNIVLGSLSVVNKSSQCKNLLLSGHHQVGSQGRCVPDHGCQHSVSSLSSRNLSVSRNWEICQRDSAAGRVAASKLHFSFSAV